jgi:hypothetical protein
LHFVGMVGGLGGTTEQVHLSAARWAWGPIFDAKRTWPLMPIGYLAKVAGWDVYTEIPLLNRHPPEILHRTRNKSVHY